MHIMYIVMSHSELVGWFGLGSLRVRVRVPYHAYVVEKTESKAAALSESVPPIPTPISGKERRREGNGGRGRHDLPAPSIASYMSRTDISSPEKIDWSSPGNLPSDCDLEG